MRIDLSPSAVPDLGRSGEADGGRKPADITRQAAPDAEDVAHLSSGSDAVQRLKVQLDALPEIRQQRVDALKQAMSDGTYKISPQGIASAMLAELGQRAG